MTAPLHAGHRAGLLRAVELLAPAKEAITAILALAVGLASVNAAEPNTLDEPTSALDAESEHLVQQALDRVARALLPMAA